MPRLDILDRDPYTQINYSMTQVLGNFVANPAYLATITFLQNPNLQNPLPQTNYASMVASIQTFLADINTLPQYSSPNGLPMTIQIALTNGNIQYNSDASGQNTVQNVLNGVLGSNIPLATETLTNYLNVVADGEGYGIYPSPLKPLPIKNLTFDEGFSSSTFEYRGYVSQAIYGNFATPVVNEYLPFGIIIVSTPLPVTGYPLDNGWL